MCDYLRSPLLRFHIIFWGMFTFVEHFSKSSRIRKRESISIISIKSWWNLPAQHEPIVLGLLVAVCVHAVPLVSWHRGKPPVETQPGLPDGLISCTQAPVSVADDQDFRSIPRIPQPLPQPCRPLLNLPCPSPKHGVQHVYDIDIYIYAIWNYRRVYQVLQHVYEATNVRAGRDHKGPMVRHSPSYTWLYLGTW